MIKIRATTPIRVYVKDSRYVKGKGHEAGWLPLSFAFGDVAYCEWRGSYGTGAMTAQAMGVSDYATIRTFYHPDLCEALRTKQAVIVKNGDPGAFRGGLPVRDHPNLYELWGGVDNIAEENQFLEFRVRRYEAK